MGPRIARGSLETNSEADKDQGPAHVLCRVEGDHLRSRRPGQARQEMEAEARRHAEDQRLLVLDEAA